MSANYYQWTLLLLICGNNAIENNILLTEPNFYEFHLSFHNLTKNLQQAKLALSNIFQEVAILPINNVF